MEAARAIQLDGQNWLDRTWAFAHESPACPRRAPDARFVAGPDEVRYTGELLDAAKGRNIWDGSALLELPASG